MSALQFQRIITMIEFIDANVRLGIKQKIKCKIKQLQRDLLSVALQDIVYVNVLLIVLLLSLNLLQSRQLCCIREGSKKSLKSVVFDLQFPDMSNIDEDIALKPGSNEVRQVFCFHRK